jgi:hypothetical protein
MAFLERLRMQETDFYRDTVLNNFAKLCLKYLYLTGISELNLAL